MSRTIKTFNFKLTSDARTQPAFTDREVAFDLSDHGNALVTLYVQFLCSDWSKVDRWVHEENLCSILKLVYFESWSWQSFLYKRCEAFNCLFLLDAQNEIQMLARFLSYSWLSLFIGFLVEKCAACQSHRKSDFGWIAFTHFPLLDANYKKGSKKSQAILMAYRSCILTGMESLSYHCIWCVIYLVS